MYFQIQRHVEEAARFAVEGSRLQDPAEKEAVMKKASDAQGKALAFFLGFYDQIEKETSVIVQEAQKICPGTVANNASSRFSEAKREKQGLDSLHNNLLHQTR
jgi:hypothetical protein